jgi:hypothetical protein
MFNQFVKEVNLEENYNKNGCVIAFLSLSNDFVVNSTKISTVQVIYQVADN